MLSAASNFSICSFTCTSSRADLLSYPNSDSCFHLLRINARDAVGNSCSNLYWWWSGPSCGFVMHIDSNKHIYICVCDIYSFIYTDVSQQQQQGFEECHGHHDAIGGPMLPIWKNNCGLGASLFHHKLQWRREVWFFFPIFFSPSPFFWGKSSILNVYMWSIIVPMRLLLLSYVTSSTPASK